MTTHNLRERLNWLDRARIVELLEGASIACYDREPTDELREALAVNIEDGTIREPTAP